MRKITSVMLSLIMFIGLTPIKSNAAVAPDITQGYLEQYFQNKTEYDYVIPFIDQLLAESTKNNVFISGSATPYDRSAIVHMIELTDEELSSYTLRLAGSGKSNIAIEKTDKTKFNQRRLVMKWNSGNPTITEEAYSSDLMAFIGNQQTSGFNSSTISYMTFEHNLVQSKNTINITANVDPYLEVSLNTNNISFDNTVVGSDLEEDILASVKSNMNYNVKATYSGLIGEGDTEYTSDKYVYLSDGAQKFNPVKDTEFSITDNATLGVHSHGFKLGLNAGIDLLPKKYSTTLTVKVAQI